MEINRTKRQKQDLDSTLDDKLCFLKRLKVRAWWGGGGLTIKRFSFCLFFI